MNGGSLPPDIKRTSALRRVPPLDGISFRQELAGEGAVCAFELPLDSVPITVESTVGRMMAIVPGDVFLATPGWLQTRRMAVGGIPAGGLIPGGDYWVLSYSGVVGELTSAHSPSQLGHLGRVRYLGAVCRETGGALNIRQFAVTDAGGADRFLDLGTDDEGRLAARLLLRCHVALLPPKVALDAGFRGLRD